MNILIADKLADTAVQQLQKIANTVIYEPSLKTDDLKDALHDSEILIVRSTKVSRNVIEHASCLSLIIRAGAGVNTIDIEAANENGVFVANCPGKNTDAVAELAIGLLVACDRNIASAYGELKNGQWCKKKYSQARGLKGRTLGIIGFGAIGRAVALRAQGLQMNVAAYSRSLTEQIADSYNVQYCSSIYELAEISDAVSVHLASKPETKHIINSEFFEKMKSAALFINTSRGEVVDSSALKHAIEKKGIRAGVDVYENEPAATDTVIKNDLVESCAACTPHIGASTDQSLEAIAQEVIDIVISYCNTGRPKNAVNIQQRSHAAVSLVVRHYEHIGVLAHVFDALREENINVEEVENIIFENDQSASCIIKLDSRPAPGFLNRITENKDVIYAYFS